MFKNILRHLSTRTTFGRLVLLLCFTTLSIGALGMIVRAAPPVVGLGAVLTKVADGTTPFISIDPNANNSLVATLDSTSYTFDVNINTLDAQTHTVSAVTVVATLASTSSEVAWQLNSLPNACGTKTLSGDGKTMTCVLTGTYNTGTALNINGSWWAQAGVPNNTDVTASFTVSATMVPDSSDGGDPVTTNSGDSLVTVVSEPSDYEVRKTPGQLTIQRDGSGVPTNLLVNWGIQVELKSATPNQIKGVSSVGLGDLALSDNLASGQVNQLPVASQGTLVSCGVVTSSNSGFLANSSSNTLGDGNAVQDSGTWSCSQPGGVGDDVTISASGIDWAPDWFTAGKVGQRVTYWAFNSGATNETYNSPAGQNNQAVVATQIVTMAYPYSTVLAFDQNVGDQDNRANYIEWCNQIGSVTVSGGSAGVDDSSNNQNCVTFQNVTAVSNSVGKNFVGNAQTTIGPEAELNLTEGVLGPGSSDNYVAPEQRFAVKVVAADSSSSVLSLDDWNSCDAIDQSKYSIVSHNAASIPSGGVGTTHDWYSWYRTGSGSPSFADITDSDVVVEFSSTGSTWANAAAQRTVNCDDAGLTWVSDPTTHPDGLANVNLVRMRLLETVAPAVTVNLFFSVQAKPGLAANTKLINFSQYKNSTLSSGNWVRAGTNCDPSVDAWNAISNTYGCSSLADRAIVILPSPNTMKSDTPGTPTSDSTASVGLGSNWTYTLKSGMSWNHDITATGVTMWDVLPPGLSYVSAAVSPDAIIKDCNGAINHTCVDTPSARTNIGYTTLRWDRGDFNFTHSGDVETPSSNLTLFGNFEVTAKVATFIPNAVKLQNLAWTTAATGLTNPTYPLSPRNTDTTHNDRLSGALDDDWIQIATAQAFAIDKAITDTAIPLDGSLKFDLGFGNLTGTAKTMDAIDILPFNGDARSPASDIDGGYSLASVTLPEGSLINNVYVTSQAPASINRDPNDSSNGSVGSGIWACSYSQLGTSGCPTATQVTGLRVRSNSLTAGQYGIIRVQLDTFGNDGEEVYTNNWYGRATTLALPVLSSDVSAVTPSCLSVGNLVFVDANKNGQFDTGDQGRSGVVVNLYSVGLDGQIGTFDDVLYKSATTDTDGRWLIECVRPAQYYAELDRSNFSSGSLQGYEAAPGASTDPNDQHDENNNQDLLADGLVFRTNAFTVDYNGPLAEAGNHPGDDSNDNLTIDLGVVLSAQTPSPDPTPDPTPPSGQSAGDSTANKLLAITGVVYGFIALLSASIFTLSVVLFARLYPSSYRLRR